MSISEIFLMHCSFIVRHIKVQHLSLQQCSILVLVSTIIIAEHRV